ncbi:desiccation-related protein PCC13-62-like [Durio zibethinus]|uniref:Desiccation-related protein PCC13-62-like n=1 Tax=Durio zibethinus TaxID=66656 RepID=A0A6P5ZZY7_DURZI|nr:desiccation-related protein PCC13-62-like [Durio zibethinus]
MASASTSYARILFLLSLQLITVAVIAHHDCGPFEANDRDRIQFAQNLEFLEAEYFTYDALGKGLDAFAPELAKGGPPPIGARKANLDPVTRQIIEEFGYQEIGHLRAIVTTVGGIPRPLLDISSENFAKLFDKAVGYCLDPPFDPYADTANFLTASYAIPYMGLVGYVGTIPYLANYTSRRLVASLLGVESGQDAVLRALLYGKACEKVVTYDITVADFTNVISGLRNQLAKCDIKDEGLIVPLKLGAENRTTSNILSADTNSLSYARTPPEILRVVYGDGDEHKPGGFFPEGANGKIARSYLSEHHKD